MWCRLRLPLTLGAVLLLAAACRPSVPDAPRAWSDSVAGAGVAAADAVGARRAGA